MDYWTAKPNQFPKNEFISPLTTAKKNRLAGIDCKTD